MASIVKIKRSSVQGKAPTTSDLETGEIALNLRDKKLFSSDGSAVFEVGSNVHSISVGTGGLSIGNGAVTFPTTDGTAGYVLKTDGAGTISWGSTAAGAGTFPFYNSQGTSDGINVAGGSFPFYNSTGGIDNISVA